MLAELNDKLGLEISPTCARALYTGIYTDTGKLRYKNTTPNTLAVIERLREALGGKEEIEAAIGYVSPEWAAYAATALTNRCSLSEELIVTYLSLSDLRGAGVEDEAAKEAGAISTDATFWACEGEAKVLALVYDLPNGTRSVSLRAYDPERIHCGEIATLLGGGGHRAAAGFTTTLTVEEIGLQVQRGVEAQLAPALDGLDAAPPSSVVQIDHLPRSH